MSHLIKERLLAACEQYVQTRIATARQAMEAAQTSANEETKSSAGDKYETDRAMAQLERDRHAQLLAEALRLQQDLNRLDITQTYKFVQPGSLVETDKGWYFISIGAGKLTLNGRLYVAVSPASPLALAFVGKHVGEVVRFNQTTYRLLSVS